MHLTRCEATGTALLGGFAILLNGKAMACQAIDYRFDSCCCNEKRKTVPVCCERWLMPYCSHNMVHGSSQGGCGCSERRRRFLAESNCSQGRRKIKGRVATRDERNATLQKRHHWEIQTDRNRRLWITRERGSQG